MRILIIHNKYQLQGGEDTVFDSETRLLIKNGHEVDVLLFNNDVFNSSYGKLTAALGSIYNFKSSRLVKDKILHFKPDIIHVHNFFHIASPSIFFTAKRLQIPVVMTLHNYRLICPSATLFFNNRIYEKSINKMFPFEAIWKGVYRNSRVETAMLVLITGIHKLIKTWNRKIDFYIALTEFSKKKFLDSSLKVSGEKIIVKPNFVEDCGFQLEDRENFYLFVGRLSVEKGISRLIEAATKLPQTEFVIIGDGPLKSTVEKAMIDLKNIRYLGFKNRDFILEKLKKARALIFPSLWYEGFPMTILEAFSCGTPVIASSLGGPKEIISSHQNGLLFDYTDPLDLVNNIEKLSKDDHLHLNMCKNARETYENLYTPEKNYHQLINIYAKAIKTS